MKRQANILVVDDNKDLLNTFALILKRKGYIVDTAMDGLQALEKFKAHHFDVVLMDVVMPGMNGVETLRRMRESNSGAKIILMTAYCEDEQLRGAFREGVFETLYKPVNIGKLMELLEAATQDPLFLTIDNDDFRYSFT
jgi:CheY-like chemotaxis protein